MLVHKGGQINNVQLITGLRIAEMSQLQHRSVKCTKNGSYCEMLKKGEKVRGRGGGSFCENSIFFLFFFFFLGGGGGWVGGGGGQGGCELRSEAFVNIQKKIFFYWGGVGAGGRGGGVGVDANGDVKLL